MMRRRGNPFATRKLPKWYDDAKFGVMIHWTPSAIPAFAVTSSGNLNQSLRKQSLRQHFINNPYAEWYSNSIEIGESPAQIYHIQHFGSDTTYRDIAHRFTSLVNGWSPAELVTAIVGSGARYVVPVAKHHDGYTLWPSSCTNPHDARLCVERDFLGELADRLEHHGLKFGCYYSTGIDRTFDPRPIVDAVSLITACPPTLEYANYCKAHIFELIDRYKPGVLWADIGYSAAGNPHEIFEYYYSKIPDGVVNDRWSQTPLALYRAINRLRQGSTSDRLIRRVADSIARQMMLRGINLPSNVHSDFLTPEYTSYDQVRQVKWECVRGIGTSFGFNQFTPASDYLSGDQAIRLLVDIVSKNGNLLLNVGPRADGRLCEAEERCLKELGIWLTTNGEAVYATRPCKVAEGRTTCGVEIRFTRRGEFVYAILLDSPRVSDVTLTGPSLTGKSARDIRAVSLLGGPELQFRITERGLGLKWPRDLRSQPAYSVRIAR